MNHTSAQLLKAQKNGREIRITIAGEPTGGLVTYAPRFKGDRKPWVYRAGDGNVFHYPAKECAPAVEVAESKTCICLAGPTGRSNHHAECPSETIPAEVAEWAAPVQNQPAQVTVYVDMVDETKGLVTVAGYDLSGTVVNEAVRYGMPGEGWACENGAGRVVSSGLRGGRKAVTALLRSYGITAPLLILAHSEN